MRLELCAACGVTPTITNQVELVQWRPNHHMDSITLCQRCVALASRTKNHEAVSAAVQHLREHLAAVGYQEGPEPSCEALAHALNEAQHRTMTGCLWTAATVFKLLRDQQLLKGELWAEGLRQRREELLKEPGQRPPAVVPGGLLRPPVAGQAEPAEAARLALAGAMVGAGEATDQ